MVNCDHEWRCPCSGLPPLPALFDGNDATQQIAQEAAFHAGLRIENEDKETISHVSHSKEEIITSA